MKRLIAPFRGLTVQLVALLTLTLLPLGLISIYQTRAVVSEAERLNQAALLAETEAAAASERELIREALGVTQGLSTLGLTRFEQACDRLLEDLVAEHDRFSFAGIVRLDGTLVCASEGTGDSIADSETFQKVRQVGGPRIGLVARGRYSRMPVVVVADTVRRDDEIEGYVMISIPSRIADSLLSQDSATRGLHLATVNADGEIVSASHGIETARVDLPGGILPQNLFDRVGETFHAWTSDGERRVFAVAEILQGSLVIIGSWPSDLALGEDTIWFPRLSVAFPLLMWLASLGVAIFGIQRLVLRHVSALASAMRQHALGRLQGGRIELDHPPDELKAAETAFNRMILLLAQAEAKQEQDLRDKEVLLREVHHRVKNNLQLIASIMSMQSRLTKSREAKRILGDLQRRVRGLATLHRSLYTKAEKSTIDAAELIRTMLKDLIPPDPGNQLEIETHLTQVDLFPDQAVPLSMLFSEAMTNAVKYAGRPADGPARICVSLDVLDEGRVRFCIENTVGERLIPEETLDTEMGGLGTRRRRKYRRNSSAHTRRAVNTRLRLCARFRNTASIS